ncbi:hypothetical protein QJQ45_029952, partial [Haematococcus lacustris]
MAQRRAAEAEAQAQAGAGENGAQAEVVAAEAEAEAQADAGVDEAEAQLHQLQADLQHRETCSTGRPPAQADLQHREQQLADNQRLQQLQQQVQQLPCLARCSAQQVVQQVLLHLLARREWALLLLLLLLLALVYLAIRLVFTWVGHHLQPAPPQLQHTQPCPAGQAAPALLPYALPWPTSVELGCSLDPARREWRTLTGHCKFSGHHATVLLRPNTQGYPLPSCGRDRDGGLLLNLLPGASCNIAGCTRCFIHRAAEAEAQAQAGAGENGAQAEVVAAEAEAEAQADAGVDEAEAQLHQLQADLQHRETCSTGRPPAQADLQHREQQLADNQRLQQLQQQVDLVAQQQAALLQWEHIIEQQQQLQQHQADLLRREQDLTERQHQLQQQQADLHSREQQLTEQRLLLQQHQEQLIEQQARIQPSQQQLHRLQQQLEIRPSSEEEDYDENDSFLSDDSPSSSLASTPHVATKATRATASSASISGSLSSSLSVSSSARRVKPEVLPKVSKTGTSSATDASSSLASSTLSSTSYRSSPAQSQKSSNTSASSKGASQPSSKGSSSKYSSLSAASKVPPPATQEQQTAADHASSDSESDYDLSMTRSSLGAQATEAKQLPEHSSLTTSDSDAEVTPRGSKQEDDKPTDSQESDSDSMLSDSNLEGQQREKPAGGTILEGQQQEDEQPADHNQDSHSTSLLNSSSLSSRQHEDEEPAADSNLISQQQEEEEPAADSSLSSRQHEDEEPAADSNLISQQQEEEEPAADSSLSSRQHEDEEPAADSNLISQQQEEEEPAADSSLSSQQQEEEGPAADSNLISQQQEEEEPAADSSLSSQQQEEEEPAADSNLISQHQEKEPVADSNLISQQQEEEPVADSNLISQQQEEEEPVADSNLISQQQEDEPVADSNLISQQQEEDEPVADSSLSSQQQEDEEPAADSNLISQQQEEEEPVADSNLISQQQEDEPVADSSLSSQQHDDEEPAADSNLISQQQEEELLADSSLISQQQEEELADNSKLSSQQQEEPASSESLAAHAVNHSRTRRHRKPDPTVSNSYSLEGSEVSASTRPGSPSQSAASTKRTSDASSAASRPSHHSAQASGAPSRASSRADSSIARSLAADAKAKVGLDSVNEYGIQAEPPLSRQSSARLSAPDQAAPVTPALPPPSLAEAEAAVRVISRSSSSSKSSVRSHSRTSQQPASRCEAPPEAQDAAHQALLSRSGSSHSVRSNQPPATSSKHDPASPAPVSAESSTHSQQPAPAVPVPEQGSRKSSHHSSRRSSKASSSAPTAEPSNASVAPAAAPATADTARPAMLSEAVAAANEVYSISTPHHSQRSPSLTVAAGSAAGSSSRCSISSAASVPIEQPPPLPPARPLSSRARALKALLEEDSWDMQLLILPATHPEPTPMLPGGLPLAHSSPGSDPTFGVEPSLGAVADSGTLVGPLVGPPAGHGGAARTAQPAQLRQRPSSAGPHGRQPSPAADPGRLHPSAWGLQDVASWLRYIDLGQYATLFLRSGVDGQQLLSVTDTRLKVTGSTWCQPNMELLWTQCHQHKRRHHVTPGSGSYTLFLMPDMKEQGFGPVMGLASGGRCSTDALWMFVAPASSAGCSRGEGLSWCLAAYLQELGIVVSGHRRDLLGAVAHLAAEANKMGTDQAVQGRQGAGSPSPARQRRPVSARPLAGPAPQLPRRPLSASRASLQGPARSYVQEERSRLMSTLPYAAPGGMHPGGEVSRSAWAGALGSDMVGPRSPWRPSSRNKEVREELCAWNAIISIIVIAWHPPVSEAAVLIVPDPFPARYGSKGDDPAVDMTWAPRVNPSKRPSSAKDLYGAMAKATSCWVGEGNTFMDRLETDARQRELNKQEITRKYYSREAIFRDPLISKKKADMELNFVSDFLLANGAVSSPLSPHTADSAIDEAVRVRHWAGEFVQTNALTKDFLERHEALEVLKTAMMETLRDSHVEGVLESWYQPELDTTLFSRVATATRSMKESLTEQQAEHLLTTPSSQLSPAQRRSQEQLAPLLVTQLSQGQLLDRFWRVVHVQEGAMPGAAKDEVERLAKLKPQQVTAILTAQGPAKVAAFATAVHNLQFMLRYEVELAGRQTRLQALQRHWWDGSIGRTKQTKEEEDLEQSFKYFALLGWSEDDVTNDLRYEALLKRVSACKTAYQKWRDQPNNQGNTPSVVSAAALGLDWAAAPWCSDGLGQLQDAILHASQSTVERGATAVASANSKVAKTTHAPGGSVFVGPVAECGLDYLSYTVRLLARCRWDELQRLEGLSGRAKQLGVYRSVRTQKFIEFTETDLRNKERKLREICELCSAFAFPFALLFLSMPVEAMDKPKKVLGKERVVPDTWLQEMDSFFERLMEDANRRRLNNKRTDDRLSKELDIMRSSAMFSA